MSLLVVDTDVASAILKRRVPPQLAARLAGQTICVTFVTVGELVKWTEIRSWGPRKLADLAAWFDRVVVLAYDDGQMLPTLLHLPQCEQGAGRLGKEERILRRLGHRSSRVHEVPQVDHADHLVEIGVNGDRGAGMAGFQKEAKPFLGRRCRVDAHHLAARAE